jgi:amino acid transporter
MLTREVPDRGPLIVVAFSS